ncbi:MAG: hypothetical protein HOP29_12930 [Phycisphaerales bacterium]|nr:hypothetical protein [Phycisphaerales bacterium]
MPDERLTTAWRDMAQDNCATAGALYGIPGRHDVDREHLRSVVSRAYYAAYAMIHARLLESGVTPPSRGNFSHAKLPVVLYHSLEGDLGGAIAATLWHVVDTLYKLRLVADYDPLAVVDDGDARMCLAHKSRVFKELKRC